MARVIQGTEGLHIAQFNKTSKESQALVVVPDKLMGYEIYFVDYNFRFFYSISFW